jgi:hypothetical protein
MPLHLVKELNLPSMRKCGEYGEYGESGESGEYGEYGEYGEHRKGKRGVRKVSISTPTASRKLLSRGALSVAEHRVARLLVFALSDPRHTRPMP